MKRAMNSALSALRLFALVVGVVMAGCAHAMAPSPPPTRLEGVVVLKGNAPHEVPVLKTSNGNWELVNLDKSQAAALQNRHVIVRGHALSHQPPALPRFTVDSVESDRDQRSPR